MAMQWIDDVRQTAIIDEAEALAVRHLQAPFAPVLAKYAAVGFDMRAVATELKATAATARKARAEASTAQAVYEIQSEQSREKVAAAKKYLDQLRAVTRFARAEGHPLRGGLDRLFVDDFAAESWSNSTDFLAVAFARLANATELTAELTGDLQRFGMPADFIAQGQRLFEELQTERDEAGLAASTRHFATGRLHELLDGIVQTFERIDAARDLVIAITGEDLPGLELTLVRGAAAARSASNPAPTEPGL